MTKRERQAAEYAAEVRHHEGVETAVLEDVARSLGIDPYTLAVYLSIPNLSIPKRVRRTTVIDELRAARSVRKSSPPETPPCP